MAHGISPRIATWQSRFQAARFQSAKLSAVTVAAAYLLAGAAAAAQTPVLLPGTITNVVGSLPAASATTSGSACATNSPYTASDNLGDGCPATSAVFQGTEDSIAVDPLGNIFLGVLNNAAVPMIRRIDARTGLITNIAGTAAGQCASGSGTKIYGTTAVQTDKFGDGCPITYAYNMQKPTFLAVDPYGNLLISTTADYSLHMVCYAQSPLCSAAKAAENIMIPVVGCATTSSAAGSAVAGLTPGTAGDGTVAVTTGASSCAGVAGVGKYLYGVIADKWDNVYFADSTNGRYRVVAGAPSITVNGTTYTNPLYATLATSTGSGINYSTSGTSPLGVHQGYVYPIAGGGTVCTASGADAYGDGCPFYQTTVSNASNGSYLQGVAVDSEGDFIFLDGNGYLRVIYEGGTVIKGAITANNSTVTTPVVGTSYALIGGGTKLYYNSGLALQKGNAMTLQGTIPQTLTTDPAGNVLIGDQEQILFYDIATGYVRRLATANGATICAAKTDSVGDGCPLTGASFGAGSALLSLAEDGAGNLYMLDPTNHLVRKVITTLQPTTAVNGSVTTSLAVHSPLGGSVAVTAATGSDISVGTVTCAGANADGSVDCSSTVTYAPKKLGQRNDSVSVATTISGTTTTQNVALSGLSTGTALVFDPSASPITSTIASLTTGITAIALDGTGNAYVSGTQGITRINSAGSTTSISGTGATYIAVDAQGSVYTSSSSLASPSSSITKYTYSASAGTYSSSTISIPSLSICTGSSMALACGAATQIYGGPLAVDALGGIYFVDVKNLHAFKLSQSTTLLQQLTQTAFTAPTAMTQDSYGNLLVLDGTKVLEVPPSGFAVTTLSPYANTPIKLTTALTAPTGIAVDQAENVYIADTVGGVNTIKVQSASNYAQSAANYQYTMPGVTGTALAVDGAGNLYVTSGGAGVTVVTRNAETYNFGTSLTASDTGVFLNTGATNSTGFVQTDTTTDFTETAPSTPMAAGGPTCNLVSTVLLGGGLCNVTFTFTPTANGSGDTPDVISLLPGANTLGQLSLDATKTGANATTATAITGNTTGLIYSTGTETTFTVTVSETPAAVPTGTVAVTIDTNAPVNYTLTQLSSSSATATVPVSGLSAGVTHTISATYGSSSGITGSSSGATSFMISSATTSVSWTPGTTSIQYSAPVGTAALNATSSSPAKSGSIAGVFIYTATPAGGSAQNIHSASYLPIGTYALGVTFMPTDAVNYQSSTGSVGTFNVTMANTTAGLGATQTVVASDGTGTYTSMQAAVNALPTGGSIYIKPGTYTGDITVVQPNISFRGLGGDPTKVILTHSGGAFSNSGGVYQYAGEFTIAQNNSSQLPNGSSTFSGDEGSATLVVAKGTNTAISSAQQSPTGFYAENLSLVNTYNTDNTTMTTTYVSGGNCVAGNGTSYSYQTLYNMQIECASQALALWITSDLSVMNNVFATSRQDTVYTASPGQSNSTYVPTRQYWFRGKVSGDVDYIFGDAAAVFDSTSIYTDWHGATASSGTETIHAQNMEQQTPGYLSGYIMNNAVFTSQSSGMTNLYFGRPYGPYSTWVMLNSYIDQTNANGYTNGLGPSLVNATFLEYNDIPYTDPATGSADLNGVPYIGTGGSSGQGVTGTRESQFLSPTNTQSTNPGTPEFGNMPPTTMTQAQAQAYFPTNFLSQTVPTSVSSTANWNPTTALATNVNAFTSAATVTNAAGGSNVTIVMRPQTPGLGAIVPTSYSAASPTPVTFTVPTGTYTLRDTIGGNTTTLASGTLDATGEAYYSTSTLSAGAHSLTWTYSGDSNFSGSTSAAYALTISAASTTTTLSGAGVTYGTAASVTATVSASSATPTGNVTLTIDGTSMMTQALSGGTTTFSVTGLLAGSHSFSASYAGAGALSASSTTSNFALTVSPATVTVTGSCANRGFDHASSCSAVVGPLQYSDTVATVFTGTPTGSTPALPNSPAGSYAAIPLATLSSFGSANYTLSAVNGSFTVSGGALQSIIFPMLPNFAHGGSYQLTAYTTSGLPVTYTITGGSSYASISGTTLTVTGAGVVTIQASTAADPTGDYAQATAVSRSFTAQ